MCVSLCSVRLVLPVWYHLKMQFSLDTVPRFSVRLPLPVCIHCVTSGSDERDSAVAVRADTSRAWC